jgi:decaprenylphospho-beta-D-erythro-pentofuranosid-2-ulose 2-reductase
MDALGGVQSVLVLGGTSEIGLACVRALSLRPGSVVVLAGRDRAALEAAGKTLAGPARVEVVDWDATGGASAADAVVASALQAAGGDLDVVLAAAGVLGDQERAESSTEYAAQVLEVNLVGVGAACITVARRLREQGHGTLVVLSSVAGVRPRRDNFVYGASKAGLDALGGGLADALEGSGARVVVVRPGFVRTRMTEGMAAAPFATTADKVAEVVAGAVRKGTPLVYAPGVLRYVFGVLRHAPRPVWRKLAASRR